MTGADRARLLRTASVALGAATCVLVPSTADAHLVTTGLGPIYDGISHVLVSPDDLVPIVAMALLAGLQGPAAGRRALFTLTLSWVIGGLAGFVVWHPLVPQSVTTASFLVIGVLTAADRRLPLALVTVLAVAMGLVHGWLNGAGIAESQREALALAGVGSAIFVLVALASALAVWLRDGWTRIVVRVAGSWVAAIGLLMLGWSLRA